jgi:branched-subunit amino acid aminotransferase/4-amino-4-deoxychorismate lyase
MKAILNNQIIDLEEFRFNFSNRGFRYGDGLFETIAIYNDQPRFLELHLNRLFDSASKLRIHPLPGKDALIRHIATLKEVNDIGKEGIIRIHLWRDSEGTYLPLSNDASFLITTEDCPLNPIKNHKNVGFSFEIVNVGSQYSHIKSMSALHYVMMALEKKAKELDEIIVLDHRGYVSEALSSNLFWKKGHYYYTPSFSTGCIRGVMQRWLMDELQVYGHRVKTAECSRDLFLESDCIFTTNAVGIGHVLAIDSHTYQADKTVEEIIRSIS